MTPDKTHAREYTAKRTAFTSTYINKDGTKTLEYSPQQQNYNDGKTWQKIDNKLLDNGKPASAPNLWESLTSTEPQVEKPSEFTDRSGVIGAQMNSLIKGISFTVSGKKITMIPIGAQNSSCPSTPNYDAGKDGNRTSMTVNGQTTTYCYNSADQLVSSSDPTLTNAQYDSHGNTTSLGDSTHKTSFAYYASDRNIAIASDTKQSLLTLDVQNRIIYRKQKTNGTTSSLVKYGFTGSGDTPDYLLDGAGTVKQKYVTLPGDVLVTIKTDSTGAGATTYSLPNIHGDIFATVNADGALLVPLWLEHLAKYYQTNQLSQQKHWYQCQIQQMPQTVLATNTSDNTRRWQIPLQALYKVE